ncbi:MAG: ribokinase [Fimbriimonadaceae bacterium]
MKVAVLGSSIVDYVVRAPRLPGAGETILGSSFEMFAGGKGANQALAACRMGAEVTFISAVGDDEAGRGFKASLSDEGIDCSRVSTMQAHTGTAIICVDDEGRNQIVVAPGANRLVSLDQTKLAVPVTVALAQLEVPFEAVAAFFAHSSTASWRILNPAPAAIVPADIAKGVNLLVPNEQEAALLTGTDNPRTAGERLLAAGFEHVILTLGASGCSYFGPLGHRDFPAPVVHAIDTVGAGDVFCGTLAAFLAQGYELFPSIELAIKSASISVTRRGAQNSVPQRDEVVS